MNRLLFELLARWVSGLIPGVALLHIMCKTKKPGDERGAEQMRWVAGWVLGTHREGVSGRMHSAAA